MTNRKLAKNTFRDWLITPTHIAPLVILRIAFGVIMLFSTIRFMMRGWVSEFYIKPRFHFTFYGFDWVKPLGEKGMYALFALMAVCTVLIAAGLLYRLATALFFLSFTYVELIDKTTYLNHYYFVSIMALLLITVPANRYFALDIWLKPRLRVTHIPSWCLNIFKLQLVLVYFFAGLSKISYDWLIAAEPLRIWLPANSHLWLIGGLLTRLWVAYVFSWFGMLFDLLIGFFLLHNRYRKWAYVLVLIFHLSTGWFFKIGMFPYIMIAVTLVFFSAKTHLHIICWLRKMLLIRSKQAEKDVIYHQSVWHNRIAGAFFTVHFLLQLILPFRYLLYPGKLYWTEEGYRFSWRVMLMEKGGTAFFHVKDPATGKSAEVINAQYLTEFQENMMATQPDMILQYAHFLAAEYQKKGIANPIVTAESYVTLNGSGSRLYIDTTINLAKEQETLFGHKRWIRPFNKKKQ
ncbi:HTTM domain-containing protein [Mucilaginibacter sp. SMC90]|uniref:HTTM domain-containing protein n=1 Tax=Mucilaginibacter sp. SMC90 TaxID=2929803 RepID=UPI001FB296B0|nr:HTTM domain-containing protein [Mucilaginibacter sp. SMC90]UOE46247.1 HTTM domain-containing protein [Mucilaginibacter sp. SMC90]